jgi:predicted aminopeptidase
MRAEKAALVTQMRADYESLKGGLPGLAGFEAWFAQPVNNAQLASVAIYTQLVPAFQALLKKHEGDLPSFYAEVARIAKLPQAERDNEINALMPR